ncbi:MAG: CheR family methyltransferase, partial [Pseudomonadota bacterium]
TADGYIERVRTDESERGSLFRDLLIHVTAFFRDPDYFEVLGTEVVKPLLAGATDDIRVWVAGCSTGEEAYSLAMLFAEAADDASRRPAVHVFATDISDDMLRIAREGRYPSAALLDIPERYRERYTIGLHGQFQISPRIRDMVRFSAHSVIKDPPFSHLDLISCRNLLIYMGDEIQTSVVPLFHRALKPGGHLFLGPSEGLSQHEKLFSTVHQKGRLFRRLDVKTSYGTALPMTRVRRSPPHHQTGPSSVEEHPTRERLDLFSSTLLKRYAPAGVLLDTDGDVLTSQGELAKFFRPVPGLQERHVSQLARSDVRKALIPLLREASNANERRAKRDVEVSSEFGSQTVDLVVDPLGDGTTMVVFIEVDGFRQQLDRFYSDTDGNDDRVRDLEEELRLVRFRLRGTVEELETANEELKSSNEEIMSMNEELQSANEELSTVNEELKSKIDEIAFANDDLSNFLGSAQLPLIIVDQNLCIRTFTQEAVQILPLVPADTGRPLMDVAALVEGVDLVAEARKILAGGATLEAPVTSKNGAQTFLARIMPYTNSEHKIAGVTMTFTDITRMTQLEHDLRHKSDRLELALSFGNMGVWEYNTETGMAILDRVEADLFGLEADEPLHIERFMERVHPDDRQLVLDNLQTAVDTDTLYNSEFRIVRDDGEVRLMKGVGKSDNVGDRMVGLNFDITEEDRVKREKDLLFEEMNHRVKNLFAVISSVVTQSARKSETTTTLAESLRGRILALSRAHAYTLDRESSDKPVLLYDLLTVVLGSHVTDHDVVLEGPDVLVTAQMATPLGLILHELATNSCKYGALRADDGRIALGWTNGSGTLDISWSERGGPNIAQPPSDNGFGSRLIDGSVAQLGGRIERDWNPAGLTVRMSFRIDDEGAVDDR